MSKPCRFYIRNFVKTRQFEEYSNKDSADCNMLQIHKLNSKSQELSNLFRTIAQNIGHFWLIIIGHCYNNNKFDLKIGVIHCMQMVIIRKWSSAQVWLYLFFKKWKSLVWLTHCKLSWLGGNPIKLILANYSKPVSQFRSS